MAILFAFVAALFVGGTASAATQTISGDPIDVKVFDAGRIEPYYDNWASGYQYFSQNACNNVLWLDGGSIGFDCPDASTADCSSCTDFTAVSNSKPDAWTIETVYDAGSAGVRITQRIEYVNGAKYYNMHWSIENTGSFTYTDLRFMHGGDTYFGGLDSSNGHYDSGLDMVYLTNAGVTGIMGLLGTPTSPIDHYIEDNYGSSGVRGAMCSGSHLPDTVNPSYVDAGYAVEWDRDTLAPGDVWEIEAIEKWTSEGDVQVFAPAGQSGYVGDTFDYSFVVQNLQGSSDTFDLSTISSPGWTVSLPDGSTVTIGAGSSETVLVRVATTSVGTALTTLIATSQSDANINNSDSVVTTVTQGDVQVFAPAGQSGYVGDTFDYSFVVQNLQGSSDTFDLSTISSPGWTVSLPDGSTVTIGAGSSETVLVRVATTSVGTDLTTLTATSQSDANINNSDSVTTATQGEVVAVPAFSPIGLLALVGILSVVLAFTAARRREK